MTAPDGRGRPTLSTITHRVRPGAPPNAWRSTVRARSGAEVEHGQRSPDPDRAVPDPRNRRGDTGNPEDGVPLRLLFHHAVHCPAPSVPMPAMRSSGRGELRSLGSAAVRRKGEAGVGDRTPAGQVGGQLAGERGELGAVAGAG